MEPNSSKILSLHLQKCTNGCAHASVCYHKNKAFRTNRTCLPKSAESALKHGFQVYEAICALDEIKMNTIFKFLFKYPNYHVTIQAKLMRPFLHEDLKDQLQLSVYTEEEMSDPVYKIYQKMYLIKDEETFEVFKKTVTNTNIQRVHYNIYQNWLTKELANEIINIKNSNPDTKKSLDTCFTSWVVNGQCPYEFTKYVDISTDGVRRCPFATEGSYLYKEISRNFYPWNSGYLHCKYQTIFIRNT